MNLALLVGRLILVGVFLAAGVGKLADRSGAQGTLAAVGVPRGVTAPLSLALSLSELAVAIALVPARWASWAALAALGLLFIFVVAVATTLARGRRPDCHCFGRLHSAPMGRSTLVRNLVLGALAGVVAWQAWAHGAPSLFTPLGGLSVAARVGLLASLAGASVLALQSWALLNLLRQHGRILVRVDALEAIVGGHELAGVPTPPPAATAGGLPVGVVAPPFRLRSSSGSWVDLKALVDRGKPTMLVFTDPRCGPCRALLPDIALWQRDRSRDVTIALITTAAKNGQTLPEHDLTDVLEQEGDEVASAYRYMGTPSAVFVGTEGRIATPLVAGADAIRSLFETGLRPVPATVAPAQEPAMPPIPVGRQAPSFRLSSIDGATVDVADLVGNDVLVVFWNPGCGFCAQLLPEVRWWAPRLTSGGAKLVMVSSGSLADSAALGMASAVLLDADGAVARAFGATGTPMAVLLDGQGRVASGLGVGRAGVLELMERVTSLSGGQRPAGAPAFAGGAPHGSPLRRPG